MPISKRIEEADNYLAARTGCYDYRCVRYDAAIDSMAEDGPFEQTHALTTIDVGAGWTEFGRRLFERGWLGRYIPVDACIDGTDLDYWEPPRQASYFICLEVLEHLTEPARLVRAMQSTASVGIMVSTPNPETTDVLDMDATHRTPISKWDLVTWGFQVLETAFYGQEADSLYGVWRVR